MSFKTCVTAFLIVIANAAIPAAQTATGTISGVVKDDSGAAIPGASQLSF